MSLGIATPRRCERCRRIPISLTLSLSISDRPFFHKQAPFFLALLSKGVYMGTPVIHPLTRKITNRQKRLGIDCRSRKMHGIVVCWQRPTMAPAVTVLVTGCTSYTHLGKKYIIIGCNRDGGREGKSIKEKRKPPQISKYILFPHKNRCTHESINMGRAPGGHGRLHLGGNYPTYSKAFSKHVDTTKRRK